MIGFSLVPGIGRVKLTQLENYFGNLQDAWQATPAELKHSGLDKNSINAITARRAKVSLETGTEKVRR